MYTKNIITRFAALGKGLFPGSAAGLSGILDSRFQAYYNESNSFRKDVPSMKKLISWLLACCMLLTASALPAMAEDTLSADSEEALQAILEQQQALGA